MGFLRIIQELLQLVNGQLPKENTTPSRRCEPGYITTCGYFIENERFHPNMVRRHVMNSVTITYYNGYVSALTVS